MLNKIKDIHLNVRYKQIGYLLGVSIINMPISIGISMILTRILGAESYGDYKFVNSIFNFFIVFTTFGLFFAINRSLVNISTEEKKREIFGASIPVIIAIGLITTISICLYTFFDNNIKSKGLEELFYIFAPFSFVFLLSEFFETTLNASNDIELLSYSRILPKLSLFIILILYNFIFNLSVDIYVVLLLLIITQIVSYAFIFRKLHPSFKHLKINYTLILNNERYFGLYIYWGRIFSRSISSLIPILISYFSLSNSDVGFFSLAATICAPLLVIPSTVSNVYYKDFAKSVKISIKILLSTIIVSCSSLVVFWVCIPILIKLFYPEEFYEAIKLAQLLSLGIIIQSFGDFINKFLSAKGCGKDMRNIAFILSPITLIASLLLIPRFGTIGAVSTRIVTGTSYLILNIIMYRRLLQ